MPYVNRRWLGGLLTNFGTIKKRIQRLHELRDLKESGKLELLPTKERMSMERELDKLEFNLGGVADMERLPDAVVVIDLKTEAIALNEAGRLEIPIVGLVDSNCDPGPVDFVISGNDDAIRSCDLVISTLGEAIEEAASAWRVEDEKRRAEEERRRIEAEERRRREQEEEKRKAAEEESGEGGRRDGEGPGRRRPGRREGAGRGPGQTAGGRGSEARRARARSRRRPRPAEAS